MMTLPPKLPSLRDPIPGKGRFGGKVIISNNFLI